MIAQLLHQSIGYCDTDVSTSTLTISPSATAGTTITAADENQRSNTVTTWANTHLHDLTNTTNWGDGTAGSKSLCADAADATDRCLRWDDTNNVWVIDQMAGGTFDTILVQSGAAAMILNRFLVSAGLGLVDDVAMTAGTTLPTTFGDFAARAYNTAAQSIASGTATLITLDSERWDTDTLHSTTSDTSRLTATTAGRYQITGHVAFAASGEGQKLLEVLLNGATIIAAQDCSSSANTSAFATSCTISTHYNLAATNYVELRVTQRVASTLNVNASSNYSPEFEMVKVP